MTDPVSLFENSASDGIVFLVDGDAIAVATDDHHSPLVSLHSVERHGTLNKRHREIARAVRAAHRAIERARQFVTHPTPTPPSTGHHTTTRKS